MSSVHKIMKLVEESIKNHNNDGKINYEEFIEEWNNKSTKQKIVDIIKEKDDKKDKNKPKKNQSAYMFFSKENRKKIKSELPSETKSTQLMKIIAEHWNKFKQSTDEEDIENLKRYEQLALEDKKRFEEEMKNYQPKTLEKVKKDSPKNKKTKSAYNFFCKEYRPKVKEQIKDANKVNSELSLLWAELKESDERKEEYEKFVELANKDKLEISGGIKENTKDSAKSSKSLPSSPNKNTAYIKYCKENRQLVKDENPDADSKTIVKILAMSWKELPEKDKIAYEC